MKKRKILLLIISHLLCLILGFWVGKIQAEPESIPKTINSTETTVGVAIETETLETAEQTVPNEETTVATEDLKEATEAQDVPIYTPVTATPPATQLPDTDSPATEPPATQTPFDDGNISGGNSGSNVGGAGAED